MAPRQEYETHDEAGKIDLLLFGQTPIPRQANPSGSLLRILGVDFRRGLLDDAAVDSRLVQRLSFSGFGLHRGMDDDGRGADLSEEMSDGGRRVVDREEEHT